ncbi:MAG: helix-hairpin-helix domain-containing protein, partial [Chloroflexota bacterium]|nr:helix-hairpin-helix domain-containing protein [Chloroflexota bacterium]
MSLTNQQIAELLENMGSLLEMKGDTVFKIRAYQRAARTIEHLPVPLAESIDSGEDITKIPGIGKAISEKIAEFIGTGKVAAFQKLLGELPPGVLDLKNIPGIGPKTAMAIGQELCISTVEGVAEAAADGRLASLPRMGQKAADGILRHIQAFHAMGSRTPIGQALPVAEEIIAALREQCPDIGLL